MMTSEQKQQTFFQLNQQVADFLGVEKKEIDINVDWEVFRANGQCSWKVDRSTGEKQYAIKISKFLVDESEIRNTMLHELCHAYNANGDAHGVGWKDLAQRVGVKFGTTITRVSIKKKSVSMTPIAALTCTNCNKRTMLYRKTKIYRARGLGYHCSRCGAEKGQLKFEEIKQGGN